MALEEQGVVRVDNLDQNTQGQIYGTSKFLLPNPAGMVAEAEIGGNYCKLCWCLPTCPTLCECVSDEMKRRTYARVYENRLEINYASTYLTACCLCACSNKQCVSDDVQVHYFDTPPTTAGSAPYPFCCAPCTCCGKPAVVVYNPKCCGCKCGSETVFAGPCEMKVCLCFGNSCFPCAVPILHPIKNGENFLSAMKAAYESYATKRDIPESERAQFWTAEWACCGLRTNKIKNVRNWKMEGAVGLVEMDRE